MKKCNPRHGSMQIWPRVRANRPHARVRNWNPAINGALGFAGYKVGMTHLMVTDNVPTSMTKNEEIFCPVTIVECPPMKVASVRFYKTKTYGTQPFSQVNADNVDKELSRSICIPKKNVKKFEDVTGYDDLTLVVYTQPKMTAIGKKKPEVFEIGIGGKLEDKLKYAKEKLGKELTVNEIFKDGNQLDVHTVTKGKGFAGPIKRFGVTRRAHKSEKSIRNPGSLGGWCAQGQTMWRVAHAGRMGFAQRTEYNKWLIKIGTDVKEIEQNGGFVHYGNVKNPYLLIKGSIGGARKRLIKFSHAVRPLRNIPKDAPAINYISKVAKQ